MILGTYNIIFERFDFFRFWSHNLLYNGYNNIKLTLTIIFGNIEMV